MLTRIGDDVPESYRSGVLPAGAVGDMARLLELIDSGDVTRTALIRHVDDPEGDWRMRVYRRGDPIALAELLPMLGHVGLRRSRNGPTTSRSTVRASTSTTSACACRPAP